MWRICDFASTPLMKTNLSLRIEFIDLCTYLNKSNKHKNQKTEVSFYIDHSKPDKKLYIYITKAQKILIATKKELTWIGSSILESDRLEKFFVYHLNSGALENLGSEKMSEFFKYHLFKNPE